VGKHGSIAVTEGVIRTLKYEWLRHVPLIRGLDHLEQLLADFELYYNAWRPHSTLQGAVPDLIHAGHQWSPPPRTAKAVPAHIERRFFPETRITAFRLAEAAQSGHRLESLSRSHPASRCRSAASQPAGADDAAR